MIFYGVRSYLVHEFRDLAKGFREKGAEETAYYIPYLHPKNTKWKASTYIFKDDTIHLVFPVSFYESLCREMLGQLKKKGTQKQEEYFNSFKYDDRLLAFLKR